MLFEKCNRKQERKKRYLAEINVVETSDDMMKLVDNSAVKVIRFLFMVMKERKKVYFEETCH